MKSAGFVSFVLSLIISGCLYYYFRHIYDDEIFSDLKDVEIESVFKSLDTDKNGVLSLSEFFTLEKSYKIFQKNQASEYLHMVSIDFYINIHTVWNIKKKLELHSSMATFLKYSPIPILSSINNY